MKKIIYGILAITAAISIYYGLTQTSESEEDYAVRVNTEREKQNRWMKSSQESPFVVHKINFSKLDYYYPTTNFKVYARYELLNSPSNVILATSEGEQRTYDALGTAHFEINGIQNELTVFRSEDDNGSAFIPFLDATSSNTTYGGGRYLETKLPRGKTILLDFNKAYNPYCAYTDGYSCPFPPKSNILTVAIEAGEKNYQN